MATIDTEDTKEKETFTYSAFEQCKWSEKKRNIAAYGYCCRHRVVHLYFLRKSFEGLYSWVKSNIPETDTDKIQKFCQWMYALALEEVKNAPDDEKDKAIEEINGKGSEYYGVYQQGEKVTSLAKQAPSVDVETKMANGENTTTQADAPAGEADDDDESSNNSNNNTTSVAEARASIVGNAAGVASSAVNLASSAVTSSVGIAGSAVNIVASCISDAIAIAGIAVELGELVLDESVSYITTATTEIALAAATYTAKLAIDTPKKMVSYVGTRVKEMMPSMSDFLTPIDLKNEVSAASAKAVQKSAKLQEATNKINKATEKVTSALGDVQAKLSYIESFAGEGPAKLEEMGKDILYTGLSYVGKVKKQAITAIAYWEEKTSNVLSYDLAMKMADEQLVKIELVMKKAADAVNKLKAQAIIIAKKVIAVAISKICALIGI